VIAFRDLYDLPWRDVAGRMGLTERQAKDLHRGLLKRVEVALGRARRLAMIDGEAR